MSIPAAEANAEIFARRGSHISHEQARTIYQEASRLPAAQRTAQAFLELASDPDNPAHALFEWDDAVAAHEHRLWQSRIFLRSVRVRVMEEEKAREFSGFFSVRVEEEADRPMSYVRYSEVSEDERLRQQIISRSLRDLKSFRDRYEEHRQILGEYDPALTEILTLADEVLED